MTTSYGDSWELCLAEAKEIINNEHSTTGGEMVKHGIQLNPVADSPNNDAFEAIVELYYQTKGYITSAGKWFWVWEEGKKQRGYQDIDVLAVNAQEAVIVSVTSNLDDKLSLDKTKNVNQEKLKKLLAFFSRVECYLTGVEEYAWLTNTRRIRRVVAYNHAFRNAEAYVIPRLKERNIEVVSAKTMLKNLSLYIKQPNMKIQDQMLRVIQLLEYNGNIDI